MSRIPASPLYIKLNNAVRENRYIVMSGGTRSTKTYTILQFLILQAVKAMRGNKKKITIGVFRSKLSWMKTSVLKDFFYIMKNQFHIWEPKRFNKSEMFYEMDGNEIHFIGLDLEAGYEKAHGMKADWLFFNESTELEYRHVRQLMMRCPGKIIFDFNPNCGKDFWIYKKILTQDNATIINSTYKDNPFLEQSIIDEILGYEPTAENEKRGTADAIHWDIYGLGRRNVVQGLVFPSYNIIKEMPSDKENFCRGLDFGFSNDPAALIDKCEHQGELYWDERMYQRGLTNIINPHYPQQKSLEGEFFKLGLNKQIEILADGSRPEAIQDLKNCSYNIKAAIKGPNSIWDGIEIIKRYRLNVTERSVNLIRDLNNYKWVLNKNGKPTRLPVDNFNDTIDAGRYACRMTCKLKGNMKPQYDSARIGTIAGSKFDF